MAAWKYWWAWQNDSLFSVLDYFFMNDFRPLSMVTFLKSGDKK